MDAWQIWTSLQIPANQALCNFYRDDLCFCGETHKIAQYNKDGLSQPGLDK